MAKKSRGFAYLLNLIVCAICALSIVGYFLKPFWNVKAEYRVKGETMKKLVGSAAEGMDLDEVIGKDGIPLKIEISIESKDILFALKGDAEKYVNKILDDNINKLVDDLTPTLDDITSKFVRAAAKKTVNESVHNQVKDILAGASGATDDDSINTMLEDAGIDETYLNGAIDNLFNAVYGLDEEGNPTGEPVTVDTVTDVIVNTVTDIFGKLESAGNSEFEGALSDQDELREAISDALSLIADDQGNIDMNSLASTLIMQMLGEKEKEEPTGAVKHKALSVSAKAEGEEDPNEALKTTIREKLHKTLDKNVKTLALGLKVLAGVLLFTMFTWAWLVLKIVLRVFRKNPMIHLGLPIWLGWLPYLVLCLIPTLLLKLVNDPPSFLEGKVTIPENVTNITNDLTLRFTSGGVYSAICAGALLLFSWIIYIRTRKSFKKKKNKD